MEPAIAAALIGSSGAILGASVGGWCAWRISRYNVKSSLKREIEDDLHDQLRWLRQQVRKHEDEHRECQQKLADLLRKSVMMEIEMGRLRAGFK